MDGIEALPLILKKKRNCAVIMASTLTRRNAEISLKCLSLGALDYVPKPESNRDITTSIEFRREIVEKVTPSRPPRRAPAAGRPGRHRYARRADRQGRSGLARRLGEEAASAPSRLRRRRPAASSRRSAAAHATAQRPARCQAAPLPRRAASHSPDRLIDGRAAGAQHCHRRHRAAHRARARPDHPAHAGDLHDHPRGASRPRLRPQGPPRPCTASRSGPAASMSLRADATCWCAGARAMPSSSSTTGRSSISASPRSTRCSPPPPRCSAPRSWRSSSPGMGSDGAHGGAEVVAAGGCVIAQDEATSVVWGMPGAVAQAGHCSALLPIDEIAPKLNAPLRRRPDMNTVEFDFLRKFLQGALRARPVRRQAISHREPPRPGRPSQRPRLDRRRSSPSSRPSAPALEAAVVEAMTTNESFFFRDKTPFEHLRDEMLPALLNARAAQQEDADLVRGRLDRPGTLHARHDPQGHGGAARRLARRDPRHGPVDRGARPRQGRALHAVRGAARACRSSS